jgi:hypothetical protein
MTGQDGGFRAAVARFKAEVEAALTRARRAAADAKEQSTEFRRGNDDIARQTRTGRLRGPSRGQATSPEARANAAKFRNANDLPVEDLAAAEPVTARPRPAAEQPGREDEDFSQHTVLFDIDAPPEDAKPTAPAVDQTSDESGRIDSPATSSTRSSDKTEDFSQQRILHDAIVESYRPDPLPGPGFAPRDEKRPS